MNNIKKIRKLFALVLLSAAALSGCAGLQSPEATDTSAPVSLSPDTEEISAADTEARDTEAESTTNTAINDTEVTDMNPTNRTKVLKIASYNIQHAAQGIDKIIDTLKAADADIVGVQEVDRLTTRVNGANQPKLIADGAGYPYYVFVRAIDYKGGQYGTLILSKYPITSSEVVNLDAGDKEGRSYGHAVIDIDGVSLDFFNTHLSYEALNLRTKQFEVIAKAAESSGRYILTGDFNTADYNEFSGFTGAGMINTKDRHYVTFPGNGSGIDNIVFKGGLSEKSSGTVVNQSSDHYMLWAEFTMEY